VINPPITTVASGAWVELPTSIPSATGSMPSIVANVVIKDLAALRRTVRCRGEEFRLAAATGIVASSEKL